MAFLAIPVLLLLLSLTVFGRQWRLNFGTIPAWARWICVIAGFVLIVSITISQRSLLQPDGALSTLPETTTVNEPRMPLPHEPLGDDFDPGEWELWTTVIVTPKIDPNGVLAIDQFATAYKDHAVVTRDLMIGDEPVQLTFHRSEPQGFSISNPWMGDEPPPKMAFELNETLTLGLDWAEGALEKEWSFDQYVGFSHRKPTVSTNREFRLRVPQSSGALWQAGKQGIEYRLNLREVWCPIDRALDPVSVTDYLTLMEQSYWEDRYYEQNWQEESLPRGSDAFRVYPTLMAVLILAMACLSQVVANHRIVLFLPLLVLGIGYVVWLERALVNQATDHVLNRDLSEAQRILAAERVEDTFFWRDTALRAKDRF